MAVHNPPGRSRQWLTASISPYLLAHFAKSQLWHASTLLFGFFLTEACGLSAKAMGLVMAGSLALNGAIDAGLGRRWRSQVVSTAGAVRLQARGAPLTCLFFLLFCATPLIEPDVRLAWALTMLLGFRAGYPFVDVPQNALVALAALTSQARCALLAKRNVASGLAALTVGALAAPLLIHGHDILVWLIWAGCLSSLVCGTAWWLGRTDIAGRDEPPAPDPDSGSPLPFVLLLGALAAMMAASATFRTLEPYYAAYAGKGVGLLLWAAIGGLLSQPLWLVCRRWITTTGMLCGAALALSLAGIVLLCPLRATPAGVVLTGLGFGMGTGGLWLMLWSAMMSRAAAGRATGYVGTFTCVSKLAQGAAILLLSRVLAASSYRETLVDPWSAPSLLMVGALAAIAATCLALAFAYGLNRTAYDGRPATPRPADRRDRVPG